MRSVWLVGVLLLASQASAQIDSGSPSAADVSVWAQSFLDGATSLETAFDQSSWVRAYGTSRTSRGRLRVARPGRLRIDYDRPANIVVVNGDSITNYEPFEPGEGAVGQYDHFSSAALARELGFLTGTSRLDRDFTSSIVTSTHAPEGTVCLELHPRAAGEAFTRLRLYVSTATETRGRVVQVAIEDPQGNWNTFRFRDMQVNADVAASVFDYTPPAGARERTLPPH